MIAFLTLLPNTLPLSEQAIGRFLVRNSPPETAIFKHLSAVIALYRLLHSWKKRADAVCKYPLGFKSGSTCSLLAFQAILTQILKYYFASVFCLCYFLCLFQLGTTQSIISGFNWTEHYILLEVLTLIIALCFTTISELSLFLSSTYHNTCAAGL